MSNTNIIEVTVRLYMFDGYIVFCFCFLIQQFIFLCFYDYAPRLNLLLLLHLIGVIHGLMTHIYTEFTIAKHKFIINI